jgi:hypothetical protein
MSAHIPIIPTDDGFFKLSTPATQTPKPDGAAVVGTSDKFAREDHVHPDISPQPAAKTPLRDGDGAVGVSELYAREDHAHPNGKTFFLEQNKAIRIELGEYNLRENYFIDIVGFAFVKRFNDLGTLIADSIYGNPYGNIGIYPYVWRNGNEIMQELYYNSYYGNGNAKTQIEDGKCVFYYAITTSDGYFQEIWVRRLKKVNIGNVNDQPQITDYLNTANISVVDKSLIGW